MLYKLNRIGDKQRPCLTPLPICTLLVSPRSSRTLTPWSMYNLLINLLSHQLIPVLFRICISLVQFTRSNAFCQSMKQIHSSSSISKVRSAVIVIIPIASLVHFPLLNPNWSSPSTSSIFLSILLLSILAIIFAVCEIRLIVHWSLQFLACLLL